MDRVFNVLQIINYMIVLLQLTLYSLCLETMQICYSTCPKKIISNRRYSTVEMGGVVHNNTMIIKLM